MNQDPKSSPRTRHSETVETSPIEATSGEAHRRPYKAPTLRRLGSVRDLTLGSLTGNTTDFVVGRLKP